MTGKELGQQSAYPSKPPAVSLLPGGIAKVWPEGMTLRQHYAGLAMQGLLASENAGDSDSQRTPTALAGMAVEQADELLNELAKEA